VDTIRRNMAFHQDLTRGIEVKIEYTDGRIKHRHVYAIDWENPENNKFLIVNQLPVHGQNDRRPDIIIFVNGLPLVVFELKNPYSDQPTVEEAYNQIQHYRYEIPQLFDYNAITSSPTGRIHCTACGALRTNGFRLGNQSTDLTSSRQPLAR
jgi:type I restriction enzyme R subunit